MILTKKIRNNLWFKNTVQKELKCEQHYKIWHKPNEISCENTYILKDIFMVITHAVKMFQKSIVSRNIPPAMIQKRK